jgi:hypothetical protein
MSATVTVTGTGGPGLTVTAAIFSDVSSFTIDTVKNILTMVQGSVNVAPISIAAAATITATKAGSTYTLTIS